MAAPTMKELESKILKAKIEIMTRSVFISSICLSLKHVISTAVPTAATDNITVLYNPEFIAPLTPMEMAGLMSHECWHVAYQHILRRGSRNPINWNKAGDYVINWQQRTNGFELPKGGLLDAKYADMSTDEIYTLLHQQDPNPSAGNLMLDITGDGFGQTPDQATAQAQANRAVVTDILVRAYTQAKLANCPPGTVPAEIERVIDELLHPQLPWPVLCRRFLTTKIKTRNSWTRRNRRWQTVYLPSKNTKTLSHLTWAVDTSGSVTDEELKEILTEINAAHKMLKPKKMTILDCDARIHNVYEVTPQTNIMKLRFNGGGGTRFQPVLDYVTENPTEALIYFTDLGGENGLVEPNYPVLWISTDNDMAPMPFGQTIYLRNRIPL